MLQGRSETLKHRATEATLRPVEKELAARLFSGFSLAFVSVVMIYAGVLPFASLIFVLALIMIWEWSRMVFNKAFHPNLFIQMLGYTAIIAFVGTGLYLFAVFTILLTTLASYSIGYLDTRDFRTSLWSASGICYVALPTLSLIWFRQDPVYGIYAVLFIMLIVWITDTMAYLVGKNVGGPKLWPSISPNKTWSGLFGGLFSSVIFGYGVALVLNVDDVFSLVLISLILSLVAQAGDLLESAMKRNFGQKDMSTLIPGHGGVIDRVDGLVVTACAAGLIAFYLNFEKPGQALLMIAN